MAIAKQAKTTLSTKGQVILPKAIRDAKNWGAGEQLIVEDTPTGVLLRAERLTARTTFDQVRGSLARPGKSFSDEEIAAKLKAAAKRRYARD